MRFLGAWLLLLPIAALAQQAPQESAQEAPEQERAKEELPAAPEKPAPDVNDLCGEPEDSEAWIDWVRNGLFRLTCGSVSWLDGLFGERQYHKEYRDTHGTVTVGALWSERDHWQEILRFRARVYFPQVSEKFHAFLGREDDEDYITDSSAELHGLPAQFNRNAEESVFLGLGYQEPYNPRGSFDFDAGVKVRFPMNPYVRGSYRYARKLSDRDLLRLRETLFWENRERLGITTHIDFDHVLTNDLLVRFTGSATFSERKRDEGVRWFTNAALFHLVSERRALAYEFAVDGGSRREVKLTSYGFTTVYRQRIWREWLTMDVRTGINWPRYSMLEDRHSNLNASLAFEMRFGRD